jgi:hypothetical protein
MAGAAPNSGWLSGHVALDEKGFVRTGREAGGGSAYETSRAGVFAVGDVRAGSVKRVASATGEGSVVISKVWEHLDARARAGPARPRSRWRQKPIEAWGPRGYTAPVMTRSDPIRLRIIRPAL